MVSPREGYVPVGEGPRAAMTGEQRTGTPDLGERAEVTVVLRRATPVRLPAGPAQSLSRAQFAARHGARADDIDKVRQFAQANGLEFVSADQPRRAVVLAGTLGALADAFAVTLVTADYQGSRYQALTGAVHVPAEFAPIVQGVFGLDTRPVAAPRARLVRPEDARSSFTALDLARLYNFPTGLDGTGQTIAIIELGGGYQVADLNAYFSGLGLATPSVQTVQVDGADNTPTGDPNGPDGEVMLDIEVAGAVAPGASILVYFSPASNRGFIDAVSTAVLAGDSPSSVSISWGGPENLAWDATSMSAMDGYLEDAAAIGIAVCVAAGDNGSSDGIADNLQHCDFPASSPYSLACGGTILHSSDAMHIDDEVVWNDDSGATGGGVSDVFPSPPWQATAGVPPTVNPGGFRGRGLPDVAGDASQDTGYQVRVDGGNYVAGGTSAVAPLWAGLIARMNQYLGDAGTGFLNAVLYGDPLAQQTFRDITSGNNGSYSAGQGWDPCTGWGSPGGDALLQLLGVWNFAQWQAS